MKKRRLVLVLIVLSLVIAEIFASGANESSPTSESGLPKLVYYVQPPANYQPTDPEVLADIKQRIIDDIGIDVDFILAPVDPTEYKNKLNLLLAGGEKIDIFLTNGWEELQKDGMLADITDGIKQYPALLDVFGSAMGGMQTADGRIWGVPRNGDAAHYPVWIRKDWLDELGLDVPTTIEEYEKVLQAFSENDPAGNGKTIPLLTSFANMPHCFLGAFAENGTGVYIDENGQVWPYFMSPGYKQLLELMNKWYMVGLIDKETFIYTDNQRIDLISQGRVGSTALWFSRTTFSEATLQKLFPEAEFVIAYLEGPAGYAQTVNAFARLPIAITESIGTQGYVISSRCEDVDAALKFLNWGFTSKENYLISRYGLEGKGWQWVDEEKGIFELIVPQTGDEYCAFKGLVTEMAVREKISPNERHVQYIFGGEIVDFSNAKYPTDGGMHFDVQAFYDVAPNFSDVLRIFEEESLKFISGVRDFSTYDDFLSTLRKAGLDAVSEEITKQYNEMK